MGLFLLAWFVITNRFFSRLLISCVFAIYMLQFISQMHGLVEMHFFFFINIVILLIYQDWRILIPYTLLTVVHHCLFFYFQLQGNDMSLYFLNAQNITFHTFVFHLGLASFMAIICGWWAVILNKNSEQAIENTSKLHTQLQLLQTNVEFAIELTKGNFDKGVPVEKEDTLGHSLMRMRERLLEAKRKESQENFVNKGLTLINELLRADKGDLQALTDQVVSQIVNYLKATQAGLFIVQGEEENDPHLWLISAYAYERKKFIHKRIEIGEGLVGQAYLEKDTLYLTDIPDKYLSITSGLGRANPTSIVLIPIQSNEAIVGVLELASFLELEDYQIGFLKKVAESLAASIISAKIRLKTHLLLEESRQQAQQLGAQEEEMRQNMEELEATQEDMRRTEQSHLQEIGRLERVFQSQTVDLQKKDIEMRGFLSAVDSTLAMIEFDLQGRILTANESFLQVMGYTLEEIVGNHHRLFVEKVYSQSEQYASFWQQLSRGIAQTGEVKRLTKQGKGIYLSASYTPVFNEEKRVVKIIKFAQDVTGQKYLSLDYQSQLQALSRSNAVIEFDLEGHILSANENFLTLMNYELHEIKGMHHRIFVQENEGQSSEYNLFWEKLGKGEYISGEFERIAKGGKKVWIKGSYNPIQDLSGKVYKVIKYAGDVTTQKQLQLQALAQVEELQAQEEEIRQNLEELQATQEEVERTSLELQAQIAAIDSSLATIEFDLEGTILKANANFLGIMGYRLEEVLQHKHSLFVEKDYRKSKAYEAFWQELKRGKAQIGKVKRLTKSGQPLWLNASYTPVFDTNHQVVKVIKLAQVIEVEA